MSRRLRIVTTDMESPPAITPVGVSDLNSRIQQLQAEAHGLVREHVAQLRDQLLQVGRLSDQIADGGDLYPPGIRELAQRLKDDSATKANALVAIMGRTLG